MTRLADGSSPTAPAPDVVRASSQYGPFYGRAWLNTAHQGPLPRAAQEAASDAVARKASPHRIDDDSFASVPEGLRMSLARLIGGRPDEVVLGNSASYGLHLLANGFPWRSGDEVLLVDGDYPATVLPWLRLASRGVQARLLRPTGASLTADELAASITPATRVLALSWVNSFNGHTADIDALGDVCRSAGVTFVVNATHGAGVRSLDVRRSPVDAVSSCGYKWLCGPYGTGFAWVRSGLLEQLSPSQAYWLAMREGRPLDQMRDYTLRDGLGPRAYDLFCPANFFNFMPWRAAVDLVLDVGVPTISAHVSELIDRFVSALDLSEYELISPEAGPERSTLVVVHRRDGGTREIHSLLGEHGVDAALREGNIRLSPHFFNTHADLDRALDVLGR